MINKSRSERFSQASDRNDRGIAAAGESGRITERDAVVSGHTGSGGGTYD